LLELSAMRSPQNLAPKWDQKGQNFAAF